MTRINHIHMYVYIYIYLYTYIYIYMECVCVCGKEFWKRDRDCCTPPSMILDALVIGALAFQKSSRWSCQACLGTTHSGDRVVSFLAEWNPLQIQKVDPLKYINMGPGALLKLPKRFISTIMGFHF